MLPIFWMQCSGSPTFGDGDPLPVTKLFDAGMNYISTLAAICYRNQRSSPMEP